MKKIELAIKRGLFYLLSAIFKRWFGNMPMIELEQKHIEGCEVLINRDLLLQKLPKNAAVAEIGVENALFSERIMTICKPAHLDLNDWWLDKQTYQTSLSRMEQYSNVTFHKSKSVDYLKSKTENTLDWVYLDTDHTYPTTKAELEEAHRVIREDGMICGHDYTSVDYSGLKKYGVVEAVNEFCMTYNYKFLYLTHEASRHISFVIQKIKNP